MTQPQEKRFGTRAGVCLLFGMLLFAVLLLTATRASAASVVASGDCGASGSNVTWSLDSDGVFTISGSGDMKDYSLSGDRPWYKQEDSIKKAVIKAGVTRIGDKALYSCSYLTSVTIPSGVKSLGYGCFDYCYLLASVTIPNTVTSIGSYAFEDCNTLKNITIPNSVTFIGNGAFRSCDNLEKINVNGNNANYSSDTDGCLYNKDKTALIQYPIGRSAQTYMIAKTVKKIESYAFYYGKKLTGVTIPNGVTSIEYSAFDSCENLTSVSIPSSVTSIGGDAFEYCKKLTNVSIPSSVTSIGGWAFANCDSLKSITIPSSVTYLGSKAFYSCDSLEKITVNGSNQYYSSDSAGCLYNKGQSTLIQYPGGRSAKTYAIAKTAKAIESYAFYYATNLTGVTIPNGVTSIGSGAFEGCKNLTSVSIPNGVKSIEYSTFDSCANLTSVSIPNTVTSIGGDAFEHCQKLTSISIPNSVTSIGSWAFSDCDSLKSITVPSSVESIKSRAFSYCEKLNKVQILSKTCTFESGVFYSSPVTLYGYSGSTTQTYANSNSINFVTLSDHTHTYGAVKVTKATMTKDGSRTKTCSICGKMVTVKVPRVSTVKLAKTSYVCTGKVITPTVTVKDSSGKALTSGTDYTLTYAKGRKAVGVYTVKVTFKGNYSGSKTLTFKIIPGQVTGLKQQKRKGINIEWKAVTGADYYEVYQMDTASGKFVWIQDAEVCGIGNSNLRNQTLQFKVRAVATGNDGKLYRGAFSKVLTAVARS